MLGAERGAQKCTTSHNERQRKSFRGKRQDLLRFTPHSTFPRVTTEKRQDKRRSTCSNKTQSTVRKAEPHSTETRRDTNKAHTPRGGPGLDSDHESLAVQHPLATRSLSQAKKHITDTKVSEQP